ncbi:MAG: SAM-dependent chlorinase/fluorinase [Chitinophagales bacterium]|nr:SAM-dependent chlorinase/fluorinase [Chitinophagales bacterium]
MPIITLTSDLGLKDHYVAALKGSILSEDQSSVIVDISHLIQPYNILEASYIVKNTYPTFPEGTLHVLFINIGDNDKNRFIIAEHKKQFFVGSDNGIFSLLFSEENEVKYYEIEHTSSSTAVSEIFLDVLIRVIKVVSSGSELSGLGRRVHELSQKSVIQPVIYSDVIRGTVFYIDRFHNAITNITRKIFNGNIKDRKYSVIFNRNILVKLSEDYADVPEGEMLCMFNSAGYLEIAINKGKASSLLGLELGSNVLIEFE